MFILISHLKHKITCRIEVANPKLDIKPKIIESTTEPDWMKFLRPPYMPDSSKVVVIANYKVQEYVLNLKCTLSFERVNWTGAKCSGISHFISSLSVAWQTFHVTKTFNNSNYNGKLCSSWAKVLIQLWLYFFFW